MDRITLNKIEKFFRHTFKNKHIKLEGRTNKEDSAEVTVDEEFIGVVFEDNEDGETCYQFNMTILKEDLDEWTHLFKIDMKSWPISFITLISTSYL